MTARRTAAHALGVAGLLLPVALLQVPSASAADGDISFSTSSPASGSPTDIVVTGMSGVCKTSFGSCANGSKSTTLSVSGPSTVGGASYAATKTNQAFSTTIPASVANGTYTATLSGANTGSATITVGFAPSTPDSFRAEGSGPRDVTFTWTRNTEPDLIGYTLADSTGAIIDSAITNTSASCASSSRCSYGLYYPTDSPGSHGYQLVAKRSNGNGGTLTSAPATGNATLVPAPKPTPSATPSPTPGATTSPAPGGGGGSTSTTGGGTTGGSTGSTTGGGTTGGATSGGASPHPTATSTFVPKSGLPTLPPSASDPVVAQRRAYALTFNAFAPSLGIPKLPPLPATDLPSLSGEQPLPLGTYNPSLPYQGQTETTGTRSLLSNPTGFVSDTFTDSTQLAKSIAGALILLLVGAHLRRFLGTHVED